jgi:hypothetical protein
VNGTHVDILLLAYSGAGIPLWTNRHDSPWHLADVASSLGVDPDGNVIVAGTSETASGSYDFLVLKYSNTGQALWTNYYNSGGLDQATTLALDANGNIFVSGRSSGIGEDYATLAYSPAGIPLWTNRFNGTGNANDNPVAIAVDRDGDVFVTGASAGTFFYPDYATVAYSGAGLPLWTNRYDGPANRDDNPSGIAVDDVGHVFVTGSAIGASQDYTTIAYSASGIPLWTNHFNGPQAFGDSASIAVDHNSTVFVTAHSYSGAFNRGRRR